MNLALERLDAAIEDALAQDTSRELAHALVRQARTTRAALLTMVGYVRAQDAKKAEAAKKVLQEAGCKLLYEDVAPPRGESPPGYTALLRQFRIFDLVVVTQLEQISADAFDLVALLLQLCSRGAHFWALDQPWCCTLLPGVQTFLTGLESWHRNGARRGQESEVEAPTHTVEVVAGKRGAKPKLSRADVERAAALLRDGHSPAAIARLLGVHRTTVIRALQRAGREWRAERASASVSPLALPSSPERQEREGKTGGE